MPKSTVEVANDLMADGYARVRLDGDEAFRLGEAVRCSREFFALPEERKRRHSSADFNYGFRPMGLEYSITADRPDLNECFTLWSDRLDLIPEAPGVRALTDAFLAWRAVLQPLLAGVLGKIAESLGGERVPEFDAASYLQVNGYPLPPGGRDLLQDRHEDGHMLTVLHATGPGLEIFPGGGGPQPVTPERDEVLVMPGAVLTDLTGGKIPPLYHQVRNLAQPDRVSLMYFVNPELDRPLHPWVGSAEELETDLRELVMSRPAMFGLPDVPVL